jgi:hypothetical protein
MQLGYLPWLKRILADSKSSIEVPYKETAKLSLSALSIVFFASDIFVLF